MKWGTYARLSALLAMHTKRLLAMLENSEKVGLRETSECVEVTKDEQSCDKGIKWFSWILGNFYRHIQTNQKFYKP